MRDKSSGPSALFKQYRPRAAASMAGGIMMVVARNNNAAGVQCDRLRVPVNGEIVLKKSDLWSVSYVCPGLALCGALSLYTDKETVSLLQPTCLINCAQELPDTPLPETVTKYHKVTVTDSPDTDLRPHMDRIADLIHQEYLNGGLTIVHCAAGVSRSAAFCIAYLIKYRAMDMTNAYRHLAMCRPCINPNQGFVGQLIEFEGKFADD
ncbi:dual specificity protein phosphatase 18 [Adelges cooleyi]|uniref:dual specificity protein phosphatase 18 n=1 Tax=Adelges cooleyi TaxID=133065 RepID=UPI00217F7FB9|nr:dual specificity protein phosphatase 18 [Adelges cooleyi]